MLEDCRAGCSLVVLTEKYVKGSEEKTPGVITAPFTQQLRAHLAADVLV